MSEFSTPGESPPPPPRAFFGRNELIEKIVDLTENLTPIALIGAGGIGKTSIALTVLHDSRVKERFGDDRRFIRCEQFPSSLAHFLHRLSKVIGAGIENPQDLTALRPFLSSKEMLIVLDNAESILDPQGTDSQEIYVAVEELSQFGNVCLFITSRISTIPPDCKRLDIPTLSMDAAYHTFYRIYDSDEQSNLVNKILEQLDFHPLSITLLATVAHHNKWDAGRLTKEWERRRTNMLQTEHNKSLAATIELSLASPMFQELGSDARGLLGVVAFFPQGVDENNIDWLFPSISNGTNVFNKFCILSLTYRSNGFITMLAPLRDYLRPKDPKSSPLLCATKEFYFTRLSVDVHPRNPGSEEARWIKLEDVNVEHLLDVFTTIDANSDNIWDTCADFMHHLYWHKPRLVALGPKIKGLPDDHHSKPRCLFELSNLFEMVGNEEERKQLLIHTLRLWRERGNDYQVAQTLAYLSDANRLLGHYKLGIQQAKEALEIYEQLNDAGGRALCLKDLAGLLHQDGQLDAAEETAFRARASLSDRGDQFQVCRCHRILGEVYQSKGETEKAIHHFKTALEIASPSNWHGHLFWIHWSLAELFSDQGGFDDAHTHVGHAKSHAVDDVYHLARATVLQARLLCRQGKLEKAKSEVLHAADVYRRLGAARDVEIARELLQQIEGPMENGELLEIVLLPVYINLHSSLGNWMIYTTDDCAASPGLLTLPPLRYLISLLFPHFPLQEPSSLHPPPLAHTIPYLLSPCLSLICIL